MGTNNSKIKQDDDDLDLPKGSENAKTYPNSHYQSEPAQKNLVHKFQHSLYKSLSAQSSSERIDYSDSTLSSFQQRTKKLLFKKKRNEETKSIGSVSISLAPSISAVSSNHQEEEDPLDRIDPMTAAVEMLSARYDEQHTSLIPKLAFKPCSVTQRGRVSYNDHHNSNNDGEYNHHNLNLVQTNSSHSDRAPRDLLKEDAHCQKLTENWFSTGSGSSLSSSQQTKPNQFVTSQDIVFDLFLGSTNESDRRKEKDRQQRMHYLLKRIWKGIYRAKLDKPTTIVNWCCGIGVWDMEMAMLFPNAQVIGVDFKGATLSNLQHGIPNLEFRHTVIQNSFTGLESFESNSVDFIMMRDVWLINAPVQKWDNVLKESFRILKPGGWIEIAEHMLKIDSLGPKLQVLDRYFANFFVETQVDRSICEKLGKYLENSGFVDVDELSAALPLGEWSPIPSLKEIGYLSRDLLERRIRLLSKWLCEANDVKANDLAKLIYDGMDEEIDAYHSYMNWMSYTARKPPVD